MMLSGLILGIGFLMAAFTERKQALHDMICDTVVVDQWAFTAHPDQQREELGTVAWVVLVLGGLLFVGMVLLAFAGLAAIAAAGRCPTGLARSAERRVGEEWVSTCRSCWSPEQ